jgi:hypothetical protein
VRVWPRGFCSRIFHPLPSDHGLSTVVDLVSCEGISLLSFSWLVSHFLCEGSWVKFGLFAARYNSICLFFFDFALVSPLGNWFTACEFVFLCSVSTVTRFTAQSCAQGSLRLCAHLFAARSAQILFSRRGGRTHPRVSGSPSFYRCCGSVFLPSIFVPVRRSFSGSRIPQSAWPQPNFSSAMSFASARDSFACSGFSI